MSATYLNERVTVHGGDCIGVMKTLADNSVDAVVTDPPYGLEFMGRDWDGADGFRRSLNEADAGRDSVFGRTSQHAPEYKTGSHWQTGAGFSKPGIGERETEWPSFSGGEFGGANPTCVTCGGRARGKKKCACAEPEWRVKGVAPAGRLFNMLTYQQWCEAWAREALRCLKPGGHIAAFGGTKTYHRLACAIEDAGFEVRDQLAWMYATGFPKSHDVSKGIDKAAGARRKETGEIRRAGIVRGGTGDEWSAGAFASHAEELKQVRITSPSTDAARSWDGWGTALKPAWEPICLARKPLGEGAVAANVLRWGTGAINIDGCRIAGETPSAERRPSGIAPSSCRPGEYGDGHAIQNRISPERWLETRPGEILGRWPANIVHDGSAEVLAAFPDSAGAQGNVTGLEPSECHSGVYSGPHDRQAFAARGDSGSAARFFYSAKADKDDRLGSKHPTVKPVDLMQWVCRLICPPGGTVLDPMAGTGTTGEAAWREGFNAILIERETEYLADIERRMKLCLAGPDERARESIKAKLKGKPIDHGPLFAEVSA